MSDSKRILVVDDERSMREMLGIMLHKEGYEVLTADSRAGAAELLGNRAVDLVITDIKLPDGDGIEILRHIKAGAPETAVIVMTAFGSTQTAVAAMKLGAHDYLVKPFDVEELKIVVRNALERQQLRAENLRLREELHGQRALDRLIGRAPAMKSLIDMLRSVAPTPSTVLISGESGTGKELAARAIHDLSPRREAPFVSINCGALPENLLESELFGHVKGAFTDAHQAKKGLFEAAHRGTLFLDEVGETPQAMQVKLLRALQEKRIRRVGGTGEIDVDVRIVAATNRSLDSLIRDGHLREDLYYRLAVIPLHMPALRDRREDVPRLAEHFLASFAAEMDKPVRRISPEAMDALTGHDWPGNVRELENVLERAVALEPTDAVQLERLPMPLAGGGLTVLTKAAAAAPGDGFDLDAHMQEEERRLVVEALEASKGRRAEAARSLGISPRSLRYLIKKHALSDKS
jgi:two-component system response regulator PilR (NtrC family)